jgi:transmembrane sensor
MEHFYRLTAEELVLNDDFRRIVLDPTPEQALEFREWTNRYPAESRTLLAAAEAIRAVRLAHTPLSETDQAQAIDRIFDLTTRQPRRTVTRKLYYWAAAAAAVIAISIGLYLGQGTQHAPALTNASTKSGAYGWVRNDHARSQVIRLADGSSVFLKPGSAVRIPDQFAAGSRKIELKGEAFFEVEPDKSRPFFVYAGNTVTRVLGTSFGVSAPGAGGRTVVSVRTGKVSVSLPDGTQPGRSAEIVPGQQATLNSEGIALSLIHSDDAISRFLATAANGEDIEVVRYLVSASQAFDLEIDFDQRKLKSCKIRANFEGMHLMEQIDAMCRAINATYKVSDGKIVIVSRGC